MLYWPAAVLFNDIPCCLYTYDVKPEQSNPVLGEVPPYTYLYPKYFFAVATIALPFAEPVELLGVFVAFATFVCAFVLFSFLLDFLEVFAPLDVVFVFAGSCLVSDKSEDDI